MNIRFYTHLSNFSCINCLPAKTQRTQSLTFVGFVSLWAFKI